MKRILVRAKEYMKMGWHYFRWPLLIILSLFLLLCLWAIVDTPTWQVLDLLIVPAMLLLIAWWLDRREAKREETERVKWERRKIELDYQMKLVSLRTDFSIRMKKAQRGNEGIEFARLREELKAEKEKLDKERTLRLKWLQGNLVDEAGNPVEEQAEDSG